VFGGYKLQAAQQSICQFNQVAG